MKNTGRRSTAAARMGPSGNTAGLPRKLTTSPGSPAKGRSPRMPRRNDLGLVAGIECLEHRAHLARVLFIHRHRDAQPWLSATDSAHHLEAPEVRAHEKRSATLRELLLHELLALDGDVKQVITLVDEVEPIQNVGGEVEHLPEAIE